MSLRTAGGSYMGRVTSLPSGDFTTTAWVYGASPAGSAYQVLYRWHSTGDGGEIAAATSTTFNSYAFDGGGDTTVTLGASFANRWVFVMGVRSGNTFTEYLSREIDGTIYAGASRAAYNESLAILRVFAAHDGGDQALAGSMSMYLRVWSAALTPDEGFREMNSRTPVRDSHLYSNIPCEVGTTIGVDISGNGNNWTVTGTGLHIVDDGPNMASKRGLAFAGMGGGF